MMPGKSLSNARISAVVIRKNGKKEDLGVIAEMKPENWFKRLIRRVIQHGKR